MEWKEGVVYLLLAFLVVRGFWRGFSGEISGLVALSLAVAMGLLLQGTVERLVAGTGWFGASQTGQQMAAFVALLAGGLAFWVIAGHWLRKILRTSLSRPLDAVLGGLTGAAKALLVILVVRALQR